MYMMNEIKHTPLRASESRYSNMSRLTAPEWDRIIANSKYGGGVLVMTNGGLVSQPNIPKKQKDRLEAVLSRFRA